MLRNIVCALYCVAVVICEVGAMEVKGIKSDISSKETISCIADVKSGLALYDTLLHDKSLSIEKTYDALERFGVTADDLSQYLDETGKKWSSNILVNETGRVLRISFSLIMLSRNDYLINIARKIVGDDIKIECIFDYKVQKQTKLNNLTTCYLLFGIIKDKITSDDVNFLDKYVFFKSAIILDSLVDREIQDIFSEFNLHAQHCIAKEIAAN